MNHSSGSALKKQLNWEPAKATTEDREQKNKTERGNASIPPDHKMKFHLKIISTLNLLIVVFNITKKYDAMKLRQTQFQNFQSEFLSTVALGEEGVRT